MSPNTDRIAILGEARPNSLKQQLLFFDRIGFLKGTIEWLRIYEDDRANDIEFLQDRNIAFDAMDYGKSLLKPLTRGLVHDMYYNLEHAPKLSEDIEQGLDTMHEFIARICASEIWYGAGITASIVSSKRLRIPNQIKGLEGVQRRSTDVVDVVLGKLPMPSELTPWEAIFDFKADKDAQGYLQGLKVWMGDIARQKLTATEANEKLEWLIFQHKKHLEAHKLSYRWGTLGGTFVAAAEILEDLVKIKWGKVAGAVVSIFDRRLELMKAELSNPAKEISYIVKAQERFGE
jgi:hypothetical protein